MNRSYQLSIFGIIFFFSGVAAILYELLWIRLLSLSFGGLTLIVALVTAIFLAGLALGALLGGILADHSKWHNSKKVILSYSLIEIAIAILGFLNFQVFIKLSLYNNIWTEPLSFLLIFIQTLALGATWPLMFKIFLNLGSDWNSAGKIAFINTLGGSLGAFLSSFFLISNFRLSGTLSLAITLNLLASIVTFFFFSRSQPVSSTEKIPLPKPHSQSSLNSPQKIIILLGLFIAGFLGMGMEILWMRAFALLLGSTIYSFALVLTVILLGLSLGGIVVEIFAQKFNFAKFCWLFYFWALTTIIGQVLLTKLPYLEESWFKLAGDNFFSLELMGFGFVFSIVFIPSLISGIVFPLGVYLLRGSFSKAGLKSGLSYFSNSIGAILGALITAVLILPKIGLKEGILFFSLTSLTLFFFSKLFFAKKIISLSLSLILITLSAFFALKIWDLPALSLGAWYYGPLVLSRPTGIKILSHKDGPEATVTTTWRQGVTSMSSNGKIIASNDLDMRTQMLLGLVPLVLHQDSKTALVIGLGSGVTGGALSQYSGLEKLTIVEIEPAVVDSARQFFAQENYHLLDNPKLNLVIADGRNYLLKSGQKFDIITSEPNNLWSSGTGSLFSREFFEIGKSHLSENGIFFQWFHTYNIRPQELKSVLATFNQSFPFVQLWISKSGNDIFLAGKNTPFDPSWAKAQKIISEPGIQEYLKTEGLTDPLYFLSLFWSANTSKLDSTTKLPEQSTALENTSSAMLQWGLLQNGEVNTDLNPILEFNAPLGLFTSTPNYQILLDYFNPSIDALGYHDLPPDQAQKLTKIRLIRRKFIQVNQLFRKGDFKTAISTGEEIAKEDDRFIEVKLLLSQAYLKQGLVQNDSTSIKKAVELDPENYPAFTSLLLTLFQSGQKDELELLVQKGESQFPWSGEILMYKGILKSLSNDFPSAQKLLLQAREMEPYNVLIHNNLGSFYKLQGEFDLAKKEWQTSLDLQPDQPQTKQQLELL